MNRKQKFLLIRFACVIIATLIAVMAMIHFKDWMLRSESMQAMRSISQAVTKYREEKGSVPSEIWIEQFRKNGYNGNPIPGSNRLGKLNYLGLWITFNSQPQQIFIYSEKRITHSLFYKDSSIVMRLSGEVEWMTQEKLTSILEKQHNKADLEMISPE